MDTGGFLSEKDLSNLIYRMLRTGKPELDVNDSKTLKSFCKSSNDAVELVHQKLWTQLNLTHSEIRLSCVLIIDMLFMRSAHFRSLMIEKFSEYFNLTMGTEKKLPKPFPASKVLKVKSIEFFKKWDEIFSPAYKEISVAKRYLVECKSINFVNIEQNVPNAEHEDVQRVRLNKAVDDFEAASDDINSSIQELEQCMNLLLPSPEEFDILCTNPISNEVTNDSSFNSDEGGEEDCDEIDEDSDHENMYDKHKNENKKGVRLTPSQTISLVFNKDDKIKVYENSDNKDIISKLTEVLELLRKKYMVLLRQTLRLYSKYNASPDQVTTVADLKIKMQKVIDKADKLLILRKDEEDDEDDDDLVEEPCIRPENLEIRYLLEHASSKSKPTDVTQDAKPSTEAPKTDSETLPCSFNAWRVGDPLPRTKDIKVASKNINTNKHLPMTSGSKGDHGKDYWRDPVLDGKISKAIGVDLTANAMKKRKRRNGLTDLRTLHSNTPKKRLMKLLNIKEKKKKKEL